MKFIVDKEVNLDKQDLLSTQSYANTLKEIIKQTPTNSSFTIGLFGEWGSGKSSIIKTVEEDFNKISSPKVKFIIYDAWKYANDSFRRMFLFKVQEELKHEKNDKFDSFYRSKNSDVKIDRKVDRKYLIATISLLFLGIFLINLIDDKKNDLKITLTIILSFLGILVNILGKAFSDYKVSVQEPLVFAPEQFEECFDEMITLSLKSNSKLVTLKKWVSGQKYIDGLDKIVIVIDNIDRCPKELAYELITNIKNFLGNKHNLVFLIPVDDEALKRHIQKDGQSNNKEAEEFLRKFFNITLRIKPFKRFDLYDFTNAINHENGLKLNPNTVDIISKEYATNPRRIIQFFNNLISELQIFKTTHGEKFILTNESLICKFLLLREEWPTYYKKITQNPNQLNNPDDEMLYFIKGNADLKSFLEITDSITRNESYETIEIILSNSDRSSKISSDLSEAIQKKNFDKLKSYVTEGKIETKKLIDILIENLNTGIKRKTFKTDVNNTFEIISWLNSIRNLGKDENRRVFDETRYYLDKFLPFISNYDYISMYSNSLLSQELNYVDKWIKEYTSTTIISDDQQSFLIGKSILRSYLKNQENEEKLKEYSDLFLKEYEKSNSTILEYELSKSQLYMLINEAFIKSLINKIQNLNEEDKYFSELSFLNEQIEFSHIMINDLFSRINTFYPNFVGQEKSQILSIASNVNKLISNQYSVLDKSTIGELESFLTNILNPRTVRGRSMNIIDEIANDEEAKTLIDLLISCYRISSNNISNLPTSLKRIISIIPTSLEYINKQMIRLKKENNFHLTSLKDIILEDNSFTNENLELTGHLFHTKDTKDQYRIDDTLVMSKLETLITNYNSNSKDKFKLFLDEMSSEERIKRLLTNLIATQNKEKILSLSRTLQTLVFDVISEDDKIFQYEDNIDFLKAMAEKGSPSNISSVVKVVVNKLNRKEKQEEAIEILEHIKNLKSSDKNKIESNIADLENEELIKKAKSLLV